MRWQQNAGIDYQIVEQKWFSLVELPNYVSYTTWAQGVADNNLTGTTNNYNVRSNGTPTTPENGLATNYNSVNMSVVGLDPQNFGMPDRQGAIIMNPFVTKVAPNGMLYNGLPQQWLMYRR